MEHHLLLTIRYGVFTKILACIPVVAALPQLFWPFRSQCTQGARDFSCSCMVSSFRENVVYGVAELSFFFESCFGNFCMCGIAISSSSAVCCFSSFWQTVREDPSWYCSTIHVVFYLTQTIMHLVYPQICTTIVFNFSQDKINVIPRRNWKPWLCKIWGGYKAHYCLGKNVQYSVVHYCGSTLYE